MSTKVAWETQITETRSTDVEQNCQTGGQRHHRWTGTKIYKWIKNASGGALAAGDVIFWGTNDVTKSEVYKIGQSTKGTDLSMMAGVVTSTAIASGEFGWIQVQGYNASINQESTTDIVLGDFLKGVSGQLYVVKSVASGTAPTFQNGIVAWAAKTADSAGLSSGVIKCYD